MLRAAPREAGKPWPCPWGVEPWSCPGPIKALSVIQPWAWLIIFGGKTIENRTWRTHYRGPLLIHAGGRKSLEAHYQARMFVGRELGWRHPVPDFSDGRLMGGGFVGVVDLVDVRPSPSRAALEGKRYERNPWHMPGYWGWVLENPRPVQWRYFKGQQSLWGRFEVVDGNVVDLAA